MSYPYLSIKTGNSALIDVHFCSSIPFEQLGFPSHTADMEIISWLRFCLVGENNLCLWICRRQFKLIENNHPGPRQRKASDRHWMSLKGPLSSSPPLQSTTPSQSMSPGMHFPSKHSYSVVEHFVAFRNGVTVVTSGDLQASDSSLRSRQSETPSHTWSGSKQVPNGQRQELQLGTDKIGTKTNLKKWLTTIKSHRYWNRSYTWTWKLELSFSPLFRFRTATLCSNKKCLNILKYGAADNKYLLIVLSMASKCCHIPSRESTKGPFLPQFRSKMATAYQVKPSEQATLPDHLSCKFN